MSLVPKKKEEEKKRHFSKYLSLSSTEKKIIQVWDKMRASK